MAWFDVVGAVGDLAAGLFKTGYDIYQDQRDTNYQRDLQRTIFDREDNAIQRRAADLEAAGLNQNLAAGSAAGAGSVVGRSAAHSVQEPGSAIDAISAMNQLKLQREQVKDAEFRTQYDMYNAAIAEQTSDWLRKENILREIQLYSDLGFNVQPYIGQGQFGLGYFVQQGRPEKTPLFDLERQLYVQNQLNNAAMLQFDKDFYQQHKILKNFVLPITGSVLQAGETAGRMYGAFVK